ncbi:Uncharacterised protein [uncultured archaeon]|nr:Uncharacterised protein [uncultured archaeon]
MLYIRNDALATEADVGVIVWFDFAMTNLALHGVQSMPLLINSITILSIKMEPSVRNVSFFS